MPSTRTEVDVARSADITAQGRADLALPEAEKSFGHHLTNGGLGCALSHIGIWREMVEKGFRSVPGSWGTQFGGRRTARGSRLQAACHSPSPLGV